ncbi:putative Isoamyl acetate-hydrolyzing esterase [Seiridium unicorne]|uniref:Isoamyl acetate-hydrolyzing esterase n=1 Tax=Seiridium unicorne TaxID=138068 RepID=A0ABR2UG76_9PEZI
MKIYQDEQFLLFDDSITEYSSMEENGLTPALQRDPERAKARILTILFGANDATSETASNDSHVPLGQYTENLKAILSHPMIATQACRVLLITPPPIDEHQYEIKDINTGHPGLTRFSHLAKGYAAACIQVGESMGVPVLDLWSCLMKRAGWRGDDAILTGSKGEERNEILSRLLSNGQCTFRARGCQLFYDGLMGFLSKTWPELMPQNLPYVFPTCHEFTGELEA